ncbi:hypothetical protein [Phytohabitans rumicis]|uniref:Holin n=1 Tax=Phytohabitans rumicis TaxID=1076125 RepID=A0A6V8LBF4_9ACTN|nr:hypothetical protein [Phytohabitans rumicis]GFJ94532.1 hypothetical protein Prum_081740 [Phytohabitans rumicis]
MKFKIFGREPTLVIGVIAAVLSILVCFNLDFLSAKQAALIVVALNALLGALNALAVRPIPPAAVTYFVGAVAALLAAYGLDVTQEQVGAVNGAFIAILMFLTRGQVTPVADPRPVDGVIPAGVTVPDAATEPTGPIPAQPVPSGRAADE